MRQWSQGIIEKHLEKVGNKNRIIIEGKPGGQGKLCIFSQMVFIKGKFNATREGREMCRNKVFVGERGWDPVCKLKDAHGCSRKNNSECSPHISLGLHLSSRSLLNHKHK